MFLVSLPTIAIHRESKDIVRQLEHHSHRFIYTCSMSSSSNSLNVIARITVAVVDTSVSCLFYLSDVITTTRYPTTA